MAQKPTQTPVNIPTLEWETGEWPRHLTGELKGQSGTPGAVPKSPPDHPRWHVRPSDLRLAESELHKSIKPVLAEYNDLKAYVESTKDWIFQRTSKKGETHGYTGGLGGGRGALPLSDDKLPDTASGLDMTAAQTKLLLASSDGITLAGDLVKLIADAGNFYTRGDKESYLPDGTAPAA
jgi:hypothetical protein